MGFQLNGYETVLQAAPSGIDVHCQDSCIDQRAEYFITENCDLWMVTQTGDIYVLPFGDDEFQHKFHAKNYIPWRPYTHDYSESCSGRPKDSFLTPFWKDYIGFQTDYFECVIFWRRQLIYKGHFDGRGMEYKSVCDSNWRYGMAMARFRNMGTARQTRLYPNTRYRNYCLRCRSRSDLLCQQYPARTRRCQYDEGMGDHIESKNG